MPMIGSRSKLKYYNKLQYNTDSTSHSLWDSKCDSSRGSSRVASPQLCVSKLENQLNPPPCPARQFIDTVEYLSIEYINGTNLVYAKTNWNVVFPRWEWCQSHSVRTRSMVRIPVYEIKPHHFIDLNLSTIWRYINVFYFLNIFFTDIVHSISGEILNQRCKLKNIRGG